MHVRSMVAILAGLALAAPSGSSAGDHRVRPIAPDQTSATAAAVIVDGVTPLAHTAQILPLSDREGVVQRGKAGRQAESVLDRLEASLEAAGSGTDRLVQVHFYAVDAESLDAIRAAFAERVAGKA